jgi:excisionase family DNA binding protein
MQQVILNGIEAGALLEQMRAIFRYELGQFAPTIVTSDAAAPELLTVREAAELLDICPQTVHDMARRGLLVKHRLGGRVYLKRSELLASLQSEQRTTKPAKKGGVCRG